MFRSPRCSFLVSSRHALAGGSGSDLGTACSAVPLGLPHSTVPTSGSDTARPGTLASQPASFSLPVTSWCGILTDNVNPQPTRSVACISRDGLTTDFQHPHGHNCQSGGLKRSHRLSQ